MERFELFRQRVISTGRRDGPDAALAVLEGGGGSYPEQARTLRWWRLCLLGEAGRAGECLALFREALDDGDWWSAELLRHRDFGSLKDDPTFEGIVAECEARRAAAETGPGLLVAEPSSRDGPIPLLIALHGSGPSARASLTPWRAAAEDGWLVAAPVSSHLAAADAPSWWRYADARDEIAGHLRDLSGRYELDGTVVVAGFSRGGAIAAEAVVRGDVPAAGLISVGPGPFDLEAVVPFMEAARDRGLAAVVLVGEHDAYCHESSRELAAALAVAGVPCELDVREGLGHEFPPDFDAFLRRALDTVAPNAPSERRTRQ